ncbi:uncharacterized protein NFIA_003910 [Aspergillus fischeri NRRL 181]|uniref:Uncharacterized protein n=1 Tax=Neosartorya fischeri (strain ATCC 1020 / DSM 3700 / CBS 544.65 / FGSC A1164 / JCM 1740 / NRRL 181 / WB 181) TaxID=331117 RepID=A1DJZ6_NEOFI|nr:uncharacterized protein NFIA_003910 [Aspergillus fischeri NRRL 181]EAW17035.1 hypothetical protein NFIA_003910 [Aspergillus fischeri NRRL 181]
MANVRSRGSAARRARAARRAAAPAATAAATAPAPAPRGRRGRPPGRGRVAARAGRGRGVSRGRGGALVGVVISAPASAAPPPPPPPPPAASSLAPPLGPGRAPVGEHCYRCLQAPRWGGGAPLPFCNGYSQDGAKCLRCRALHQPCQSFPAAALPEADDVVAAQVALEVAHPRAVGLALEAVARAAQAFRARVAASGGPLPRGAPPALAPVAAAASPTPPFVSAPGSPMAAPAPAGIWAAAVQFFSE